MDKLKRARRQRQASPTITVKLAAPFPPPSPPEKQRRWVEWFSLAISLLAMATSVSTYLDQSDVNELTTTRYERRYADRVAWWITPETKSGKNQQTISIQNRSLSPVTNVHLWLRYEAGGDKRPPRVADGYEFAWKGSGFARWQSEKVIGAADIAPCTVARFTVPLLTDVETFTEFVGFHVGEAHRWRKYKDGSLVDIDQKHERLLEADKGGWRPSEDEGRAQANWDRLQAEFMEVIKSHSRKGLVRIGEQAAEDCTDA